MTGAGIMSRAEVGLKGGWWEMFLKGRFELYYFHISDLHSCLAGMFGKFC